MKFQICFIFLLLGGLMFTQHAKANEQQLVAGNKSKETELCLAVAQNNVSKVKKIIRGVAPAASGRSLWKMRMIAKRYQCNSMNIVRFAHHFDAPDTQAFLVIHLSREDTESVEYSDFRDLKLSASNSSSTVIFGKVL